MCLPVATRAVAGTVSLTVNSDTTRQIMAAKPMEEPLNRL